MKKKRDLTQSKGVSKLVFPYTAAFFLDFVRLVGVSKEKNKKSNNKKTRTVESDFFVVVF